MNLSRRHFLKLAASVPAAAMLASCAAGSSTGSPSASSSERRQTFFAFDTACVIGGAIDADTLEAAVQYCAGFEDMFSRTIETSDVARINGAAGAYVDVRPETAELIGLALPYCEESGGLFDITIGAVSSLWDFKEGVVPDPAAIEEALEHVDYHNVEVEGTRVRLADSQAKLDLGGIAKGYIADQAAAFLADRGVTSAYVNLGGNVKVIGVKGDGSEWSIGVRDPSAEDDSAVVARIASTGGSLVTSGLYERHFQVEGRDYWHILDPRTGYPVESTVVSASIYSERSIDGDGFTKPLFMMSPDAAISFIESQNDLQVLLVLNDGSVMTSSQSGFEVL